MMYINAVMLSNLFYLILVCYFLVEAVKQQCLAVSTTKTVIFLAHDVI